MFLGWRWRAKRLCRISNLFLVSLLMQSVSDWHHSPLNAHQPNYAHYACEVRTESPWLAPLTPWFLSFCLTTIVFFWSLILSWEEAVMKFLGKQSQRLNRNRLQSQLDDNTGKWGGKIKTGHIFYGGNIVGFARITLFASIWSKTTGPVLFRAWRLETMLGVS